MLLNKAELEVLSGPKIKYTCKFLQPSTICYFPFRDFKSGYAGNPSPGATRAFGQQRLENGYNRFSRKSITPSELPLQASRMKIPYNS